MSQQKYQKNQHYSRIWARFALVLALFALGGLLFVQLTTERARVRETGLRSASFAAAAQATAVSDRVRETFAALFKAATESVETPHLNLPLERVQKQRWDHVLRGQFVVLGHAEKASGSVSMQQGASAWNLSRFPSSDGRVISWIDERSQSSFFAATSGQKTIILALAPSLVVQLLGSDTLNTPVQTESSQVVQLALLARPDPLVLSHARNISMRPESLATTDSIRISEAVLAQPAVARLVSSSGGAVLLDGSRYEEMAAAYPARGTNLVAFSLAQDPVARAIGGFVDGPFLGLLIAGALGLLLLSFAQRALLRNSLAASQELWLQKIEEASSELYAFRGMTVRFSEWQSSAYGGAAVSFSSHAPVHAFGDPSEAPRPGLTELSGNWAGRLLFADVGVPGFVLVGLIEAPSPLRELLCVFMEGLFRKPEFTDAVNSTFDAGDPGCWQAWGSAQAAVIDQALSVLLPEERNTLKCVSFFVWSAPMGVVWQHGDQAVGIRETDSWLYLGLVTGHADATGPNEMQIGGPLVLWRSLSAVTVESLGENGVAFEAPPPDVWGDSPHFDDQESAEEAGDSPPTAPRSACHWLTVILVAWLLALGGVGLVAGAAQAAQNPSDATAPQQLERPQASEPLPPLDQRGFVVTASNGLVRVRPPGALTFSVVEKHAVLEMGSEVITSPGDLSVFRFSGDADRAVPYVTLRHRVHGVVQFRGTGNWFLNADHFAQNLDGIRFTETEDIPARVELRQSEVLSPAERLFAFFMPRRDVPSQFASVARSESQQRFPLIVSYPERVHLIKTNTLPVVVSLEWVAAPEHKRPYRIYLWNEQESISAPVRRVGGSSAALQLAEHGRFYWQVEDESGDYISSPRTIILAPIDDPLNADASDAKLRPGQPSVMREIKPLSVAFPAPNSVVYGCPARGDLNLPVRFHHKIEEGEASPVVYQISYVPNKEKRLIEIRASARSEIVLAQVPLPADGTFAFRIVGLGDAADPKMRHVVAASEKINGTFVRTCGLASKPDFLLQALRVTTGKRLPTLGLMHVMDGAL